MSSLLRTRDGGEARVGFVELFFDLVFVFAITQVSHFLLENLTWLGALQAAMMVAAVWWAWVYTSWVTNWLDPQRSAVQIGLFVLMAAGLVMSAALPHAFEDTGLAFGAAFAFIQVGRTLFMLLACREDTSLRRNFQRILVWLSISACLWIGGGLAEPEQRMWWWLGHWRSNTSGRLPISGRRVWGGRQPRTGMSKVPIWPSASACSPSSVWAKPF